MRASTWKALVLERAGEGQAREQGHDGVSVAAPIFLESQIHYARNPGKCRAVLVLVIVH